MLQRGLTLIVLAVLMGVQPLFAQEDDMAEEVDSQPNEFVRNHQNIFQGGASFGYWGYGFVGNRVGISVPLTIAYEKYFHDYVSAGGFLGYASYKYEDASNQRYGWTFVDFGARASFHYIHFLNEQLDMDIDAEKFDFYLTAMLIFESRSFTAEDTFYEDYYDSEFGINLGTVAGFRYKFNNNLSVYFEGGRGTFGYGTFGVSYFF
jgi:hypothetical protein